MINTTNALLSYTIPCHQREDDLEQALPHIITAANASPPVEIIIVDYGKQPSLAPMLSPWLHKLDAPNQFVHVIYRDRDHYHMANARNLSLRVSDGEYVILSATDILPRENFFQAIRTRLMETQCDLLRSQTTGYIGIFTTRRDLLYAAGGFDERFEFYGREDKDLLLRLLRRGLTQGTYDLDNMLDMIRTPWKQKLEHYRLQLTREEAHAKATAIYDENIRNNVLVANEGIEWLTKDEIWILLHKGSSSGVRYARPVHILSRGAPDDEPN
jgi:hypothetical protein